VLQHHTVFKRRDIIHIATVNIQALQATTESDGVYIEKQLAVRDSQIAQTHTPFCQTSGESFDTLESKPPERSKYAGK
jgi:hypothetical protein